MPERREIPGHGNYLASDDGRVFSTLSGKDLAQMPGGPRRAYRYVSLGKRCRIGVHVAVALAFHPRPDGATVVRHRDNNPSNNAASNLLWGTQGENLADRIEAGTMTWGERNGQAKVSEEAVRDIRRRRAAGERCRSIAADYGISHQQVHRIGRGQRWAQLDAPLAPSQRSRRKDSKCSV